jgi:hypothetical protein
MRTNTQEALLSAYIVSIGKRTPRDAAQDATELADSRTRSIAWTKSPARAASRSGKSDGSKTYKPGLRTYVIGRRSHVRPRSDHQQQVLAGVSETGCDFG